MPMFPERCKDPKLTDENGIPIYDENGYSFYGDYENACGFDCTNIVKLLIPVLLILAFILAGQ